MILKNDIMLNTKLSGDNIKIQFKYTLIIIYDVRIFLPTFNFSSLKEYKGQIVISGKLASIWLNKRVSVYVGPSLKTIMDCIVCVKRSVTDTDRNPKKSRTLIRFSISTLEY